MEDNKNINNNPTKNEIVKGKIANALTSAAKNHIVATTDDIYDTNLLEYQDEINKGMIETLSGVAKEDTLVNGISDIRKDISEIELDTSDLAKEDTLVEGVAYIVNKIETTQPDLSTIAKEDTLVAGISNIIDDVDSQANAVTSTINSKTENIIDTVNGQANAVIDTVNAQAGNVINSVNTNTTNVVVGQAQGIQDNINGKTTDILNTVNDQAQVIITSVANQTGQIISNNNQQTATITSTVNQQAQSTNIIINNKTADIINTVNAQAQSLANDIVNLDGNLDSGVTRIFDAINLIKEELQGQNSAITLTYLYDTLGDLSTLLDEINGEEMPVEFASDYARQGTNQNATLSATQAAAEQAAQRAAEIKNTVDALPSTDDIVNKILDEINIPVSVEGLEFDTSLSIENGFDLIMATEHITKIESYRQTELNRLWGYFGTGQGYASAGVSFPLLKTLIVPNCSYILGSNQGGFGQYLKSLEYVDMQYANPLSCNVLFEYCDAVKYINLKNMVRAGSGNYNAFLACPKLICIEYGVNAYNGDNLFQYWSPTEALNPSSSSLVEQGETFTSNLEKLLYNIREHIAANLLDRTGTTAWSIHFSADVKAAILADAATMTAFTNKNWTIA